LTQQLLDSVHRMLFVTDNDSQTEKSLLKLLSLKEIFTEEVSSTKKSFNVLITEFIDSWDDSLYINFHDINSMSSFTHCFSIMLETDAFEKIQHIQSFQSLNEFIMLLSLWCQDFKITHQQYIELLKILTAIQNKTQIQKLLKLIEILQRNVQAQFSFMKLRQKLIALMKKKLSTLDKNRNKKNFNSSQDLLYWFNFTHLFNTILQASNFIVKMHVDIMHYVDTFKKLWYSQVWELFICACSENFARYSNNLSIFSSNIVYYQCLNHQCFCQNFSHMRRVNIVDWDHTSWIVLVDEILLQVQQLYRKSKLLDHWKTLFAEVRLKEKKLICVENCFHYMSEKHILNQKSNVFLDYQFNDIKSVTFQVINKFIIWWIIDTWKLAVQSFNLSNSIHEKLELFTFDCQYLIKSFKLNKCLSISLMCFIDVFELYCNMYHFLLDIYMIFASLTTVEWARRSNIFLITLDFHDSEFNDVIKILQEDLTELNKDVEMYINDEKKFVCTFMMTFIDDTSQQQNNSEFKHQNALHDCWYCIIKFKIKA